VRGEAVLSRTPFGGWASPEEVEVNAAAFTKARGRLKSCDGGEAVKRGPSDVEANPPDPGVSSSEIRSFLVADQSAAPRWIVFVNGVPEFTGPEFVARQFYEAALKKATTRSAQIQEERR